MVDVPAVVDAQDYDLAGGVVDSVQHPVGAAAGGPHPAQFSAQHRLDPSRVGDQRAGHELDHRRRDRLGQAGLDSGTTCYGATQDWRRNLWLVTHFSCTLQHDGEFRVRPRSGLDAAASVAARRSILGHTKRAPAGSVSIDRHVQNHTDQARLPNAA